MKKLLTSLSIVAAIAVSAQAGSIMGNSVVNSYAQVGVKNGIYDGVIGLNYNTVIYAPLAMSWDLNLETSKEKQHTGEFLLNVGIEPNAWVISGVGVEMYDREGIDTTVKTCDPLEPDLCTVTGVSGVDKSETNGYVKLGIGTFFNINKMSIGVDQYMKIGSKSKSLGMDITSAVGSNTSIYLSGEYRLLNSSENGKYELTTETLMIGIKYHF